MAEPDVRPPGAASPSAISIQEDEIPLAIMAGRMKKISEITSTIPEVMDSSTLNFKANFKFSRFFWRGRTPVPLRMCAINLCQSLACVKISGRSTH